MFSRVLNYEEKRQVDALFQETYCAVLSKFTASIAFDFNCNRQVASYYENLHRLSVSPSVSLSVRHVTLFALPLSLEPLALSPLTLYTHSLDA